jgi:hypothetical protein
MTRKKTLVIVSFTLAVLAVTFTVRRAPSLPAGSHTRSFDANLWRSENADQASPPAITERQKMLGDLVDHVLPGRSRQEIETLLGPPSQTTHFKGTGRDLIYPLGWERGSYITIDSEWLLIWFDQTAHFTRYAVRND